MAPVTVTIVTKNEAANIADALRSVAWAGEVIVVDAQSDDDTVAIARQFTDRVIVREWPGYVEQKNYAASLATHDWILSLDADERVTPALADEIQRTVVATSPIDTARLNQRRPVAYRMPRVTWHLGRWIRTTDWYPDYQLRLYDRRRAAWTGRYVHESVAAAGDIGQLGGELQHYAYRDIADHLETIDRYTTYAALQMDEDGRRVGPLQLAFHPPLAFLRNYVLKRGFAQGSVGLVISALNSYYVFLKFAKLWERQRRNTATRADAEAPIGDLEHLGIGSDYPAQAPEPRTRARKHSSS